jgi:hypothetical protein
MGTNLIYSLLLCKDNGQCELDQHQRQLAIKDKLAVAVLYAAEQACHLVRGMINRAFAAQYTREGNA